MCEGNNCARGCARLLGEVELYMLEGRCASVLVGIVLRGSAKID